MAAGMQSSQSSSAGGYPVFTDMRWPEKTGIGNVMAACIARKPAQVSVVDLQVDGGIGSPLSPWAVSRALGAAGATDGVFWNPGFIPALWSRVPQVVTVHDLTHLHFYTKLHKIYYGLCFKPLYRRCSAVVCVSEYTRTEFLEWSGMDPARVHVVLNGVGPEYAQNTETLNLPYRYVLYPGNQRGYKNLDRLLEAYAASTLRSRDIHLALTGNPNEAFLARAQQLGVASHVHFLGRLPDADLPRVYKGALAVAFVSLYEGFGLPIVEGMASGTPVLTSNVSAMPEVAGDAALVVDPYSVLAITKGLDHITGDESLRGELIARGHERVRAFDWDRSAQSLWSIVERVRQAA